MGWGGRRRLCVWRLGLQGKSRGFIVLSQLNVEVLAIDVRGFSSVMNCSKSWYGIWKL
jgi:hypothetical protein